MEKIAVLIFMRIFWLSDLGSDVEMTADETEMEYKAGFKYRRITGYLF